MLLVQQFVAGGDPEEQLLANGKFAEDRARYSVQENVLQIWKSEEPYFLTSNLGA